MKSNRILNGYVVVYKPNHPKAMKTANWKGYVYEHICMAEEDLNRSLLNDEEVHHLDLDRSNNNPANLIVLSKKAHRKLHKWIENGAFISKDIKMNPVNSKKPKLRCKVCNKPLKLKQHSYCSKQCEYSNKVSKLENVEVGEVLKQLTKLSMVQVSKLYNVSDNGLRKWLLVKHNLDKATLSQALSTLKEGAETNGEVKSS